MKKIILSCLIVSSSYFSFSQVTQEKANEFMKKRCRDIDMEYVDGKILNWDENTKLYVYLTRKESNYCVSMISQYALEVMKSDCGGIEKKVKYYDLFK